MPQLSKLTKPLAFIVSVLAISLFLSYLVLAWTEPSANPPNPNVSTPLNIGSTGQSKSGGLILNTGGAPNGLIVQNGNVGIGTTDPGTSKLKVTGTIESTSGGFKFPDGSVQNKAATAASNMYYGVGNGIYHANDSESYKNSYPAVKAKEIKLNKTPLSTLRIYFEIRSKPSSTAFGQIYRNGVAVGTYRSTTSTGYVGFTEDISGWNDGDLIQIYISASGSWTDVWTRNFRILSDTMIQNTL